MRIIVSMLRRQWEQMLTALDGSAQVPSCLSAHFMLIGLRDRMSSLWLIDRKLRHQVVKSIVQEYTAPG